MSKSIFVLCGCLLSVILNGPGVLAQTVRRGNISPLGEFSDSLRGLTERTSSSVVQVLTSGYGLADGAVGASSVLAGQRGTGSGIILSADGLIITNAHVIEGARHIRVRINGLSENSQSFEATLVGADRQLDLALLRIAATDLPTLPLADSDMLTQGQLVLAFGSPMGLENSVSMGVISSVGRQLGSDDSRIFIQTDAPINPGNSGGALVDMNGHVVGLNTFILTKSGGSEGLGFAIPSNVIKYVFNQLKKDGHVHRAQIGIAARTITEPLAEALGLEPFRGGLVEDLTPDGPAEKAGVQIGDVIESVGDKRIRDVRDLASSSYGYSIGGVARLRILRDNKSFSINVPVVEKEDDLPRLNDFVDPEKNAIPQLGLLVMEVNPAIKKLVGELRVEDGVLVAARSGISRYGGDDPQPGDVIHAVNRHPVKVVEELRSVMRDVKPDAPIVLQVERNGSMLFLVLESI